jgi:hypothetical protein
MEGFGIYNPKIDVFYIGQTAGTACVCGMPPKRAKKRSSKPARPLFHPFPRAIFIFIFFIVRFLNQDADRFAHRKRKFFL